MKARLKINLVVWEVEHVSESLVQLFSGKQRILISRVEFERDWIAA